MYGKKIYYGDFVKSKYISQSEVDDVMVAHLAIDSDKMNIPIECLKIELIKKKRNDDEKMFKLQQTS